MKKKNITLLIVSAFMLLFIVACKKNELSLTQFSLPQDKAYVRFGLLSPNTTAVMIKINGVKINGANTPGSAGFFPAILNMPDYSAVVPNGVLRLSLPNFGTANDSVLIFSGNLSMSAGKYYAVCLADTGTDRSLFAVEDKLGALPDSGFFNLRMINAMGKSLPLSLIRVDSTSATVVTRDTLIKNVTYQTGSNFIKVPVSSINTFSRFRLIITSTGVSIGNVITPPAPNLINKRSATLYASGSMAGIGTLAPSLSTSFIYNQ